MAFAYLPGIILLPAVKHNQVKTFLRFRFGQGL
jgi:hypothetical protein